MAILDTAKAWARRIKRDVLAVYFAARDPDTPWAIRVLAIMVAAYALSPIDFIPDFIPILGYLDDLLIVPLGLWVVIRLAPSCTYSCARKSRAYAGPSTQQSGCRRHRLHLAIACRGLWLLAVAAVIGPDASLQSGITAATLYNARAIAQIHVLSWQQAYLVSCQTDCSRRYPW